MKSILKRVLVILLLSAFVLVSAGVSAFADSPAARGAVDRGSDKYMAELLIETNKLGENSASGALYDRSVKITFRYKGFGFIFGSEDGLDKVSKEVIGDLKSSLGSLPDNSYSLSTNDAEHTYIFSVSSADVSALGRFTSALLPGSSSEFSEDGDSTTEFSVSSCYNDVIDISALDKHNGVSASAQVIYNGVYIAEGKDSYPADAKLSEDSISFRLDNSRPRAELTDNSAVSFKAEQILVSTEVSVSGKYTVSVSVGFDRKKSSEACSHFLTYVSSHEDSRYHRSDLLVTTAAVKKAEVVSESEVSSTSSDCMILMSVTGDEKKVNGVLGEVFGEGNSLEENNKGSAGDTFFYDCRHITQKIDLSALAKETEFKGNVYYSFSGTAMSKIDGINCNDKSSTAVTANGSFVAREEATGAKFKFSFDYKVLNVVSILITVFSAGALLCLLSFLVKLYTKRSTRKRADKKADLRLDAVKSVALALVPEQERGTMVEVPSELVHRPTVIITPKNDDGLDDDDDEPENVMLYTMIMRILLVVQLVLFFFPYCTFARSGGLITTKQGRLTGLDIFLGKENIFGIEANFEAQPFFIIMFVIPFLMLIILFAQKFLPKFALPFALTGGSAFAIFYMLGLPGKFEAWLANIGTAIAAEGSTLTAPELEMAYTYSFVIYVLLAIGGFVLLLSRILTHIVARRRKHEEEMHRFED